MSRLPQVFGIPAILSLPAPPISSVEFQTRSPAMFRARQVSRGLIAAMALLLWDCAAASALPQTVQLRANWTLASANQAKDSGARISQPGYITKGWYPVRQVPATVLQILQEDGVYPNLYYGKNLLTAVPQDLYKQDWW